jgi:hypothetical protein
MLCGVSSGYRRCSFALQTVAVQFSCSLATGPHLETSGHLACRVLTVSSVTFATTGGIGPSTPGLCDGMWSPLLLFGEYCLRLSKKCCRHLALKI